MQKRTDIHRPSEIVPADYDFVGVEYDKTDELGACLMLADHRARIEEHQAQTGGTYSRHEHGGNCQVCGAYAIYTCLFWHRATNVYIRTGFDCAEKMGMGDPVLFRAIKKGVKEAREAKAGRQKAQATLTDMGMGEVWCIAVELDDTELEAMSAKESSELAVMRDIVGKLIRYGSISEGQTRYLGVLLEKIKTIKERQAQQEAENEKAEPVPTDGGRHLVSGKILAIKEYESSYGITKKIVIKEKRGFVIMGTIPSAIRGVSRGDRISFTARISVSDNDPKFGFYSRPTGASIEREKTDE